MRQVVGYYLGIIDVLVDAKTLPLSRKIPAYAMLLVVVPIMAVLMPVFALAWSIRK